jgi:hypothetical protein
MKVLNIRSLFCLSLLLVASFIVRAQTDSFEANIVKMQQVNGSSEAIYSQIVMQFKSINLGLHR